jgi:hypothetical protein
MRVNKAIVVWSLLIMLFSLAKAKADPVPVLDLTVLTHDADQIVVGQVVAVWEIEHTSVDMQGQSVPAIRMGASLRGDRVLKGHTDQPILNFEFLVTDFGPYKRVPPKQYGMFFLRLKSPQQYVVSDPYYPFVVASPDPPVSEGNTFDRVVAEVAHVIMLKLSRNERSQAIEALKNVHLRAATKALRHAANDTDISLRLQAIAALLWQNDISSLNTAVEILLNPSPTAEKWLLNNLAASVEGIKDPKAIPLLTRLLASRDVLARRSAASAIRHTADAAAIESLMTALNDHDHEVRYQAVIGLAEITGQSEWGPSIDLFQRDEQSYLAHWREWAKTR